MTLPRTPARPMPKLHREDGRNPSAKLNPGAVLAYHIEPTAPMVARYMGVRTDREGDWIVSGLLRVAVLVARMDGTSATARWAHISPGTLDKLTPEGRDPTPKLRPLLTVVGRMGKRMSYEKAKEIFGAHILTDAGLYVGRGE